MLLGNLFLVVGVFGFLNVVDDEEVLGIVLLQVHFINGEVVRVLVMDHIAPVILITEHVVVGVHKDFDLVAYLDLESNQCHVQLMVHDHADFFELQTFKFSPLEWNSVKFILGPGQIIELPLLHLFHVFDNFDLLLNCLR